MILADTSVWIDHFRRGNARLVALLEAGDIASHPFVIGEMALGLIRRREEILLRFHGLPGLQVASNREVLVFIAAEKLAGSGVGYIDVHLLAAVRLSPGSRLWTHDRRLAAVSASMGLAM